MAKRKLSSEQRTKLREELKKGVAAKQKTADLLREVAAKYGITTITARWYLNSLSGTKRKSGRKPGRPAGKRGPGRPPGRRGPGRPPGSKSKNKTGNKPGRPAGGGNPKALSKLFKTRELNAKAAGKLVPRWQKLVDQEAELHSLVSKLTKKLEAKAKKAAEIRAKIDALWHA